MKLRARTAIATAGTAAALATTGAFLIPAASASPADHHPSHTLTFTSLEQAAANFPQNVSLQQDKDVNKAGKVIGYDVLRFTYNPKTQVAAMNVAAEFPGGVLYGQMVNKGGSDTRGTVTGGTGSFKGASGTISAKSLDQNGTRTAVTVIWHT